MKTPPPPATDDEFRRSACAVANTLDVVGDKWSLLVVRDLLHGKQTFGELLASPERIPTNLLADRLRRLEEAGIVERSVYQERPVRHAYGLTPKGEALGEVLLAMVKWGRKYVPGAKVLKPPRKAGSGPKP
jgi:DNA-binding HxlR family transcriptional regulator